MFELFKVVWDLFMMRRSWKSGQLNLHKTLIALGLTALAYVLVIPAAVLWDKHPQYAPLLIAGIVLAALDFGFLAWLGFHWWRQGLARQN